MTADQIVALLAARHSDDVFVPECKDGASYGSYSRMDAWAMARSWAKPLISAYEVKVSRSDFNRDDKWRRYLDYCNKFYFVCPTGLIDPKELPDEAGLLYVAKTGTMLLQKKKAPHRGTDPAKLEDVFRYLLMARVRIQREQLTDKSVEFWRQWLEQKQEFSELGHRVSKALRKVINEQVFKVQAENLQLQKENEQFAEIRELLKKLGINEHAIRYPWSIERTIKEKIDRAREIVPPHTITEMRHAKQLLESIITSLEQATTQPGVPS